MNKSGLFRVIAIVLVCVLIQTGWFVRQYIETLNGREASHVTEKELLRNKVGEIIDRNRVIAEELARFGKERDRLLIEIEQNAASEETLRLEVKDLRKDLTRLTEALSEKDQMIYSLRGEVEEYQSRLASRSSVESEEADPWSEEVSRIAPDEITLDPITVETTGEQREIEARVIEVNDGYDFIVISAGSAQGVRTGEMLFIYRKNVILGRVSVERVGENVAAVKTYYKSLRDSVRKGDRVRN